jgi:crossover junction endodeoxyribonuclease RuvC
MRVVGIDPGLHLTGYGVLDYDGTDIRLCEAGFIKTNEKQAMPLRLIELTTELDAVLTQFSPEIVAIEEIYSHYSHPRTAIIMAHARGVILHRCAAKNIEVVSYASTRIKKSLTGNGHATKQQVQKHIASSLSLPKMPEPPDVADALAVAVCHCHAIQSKGLVAA